MRGPSYDCGAVDPAARFLDPVHYDCRFCRERIVALLLARQPTKPSPPPPPEQVPLFDDVTPRPMRRG